MEMLGVLMRTFKNITFILCLMGGSSQAVETFDLDLPESTSAPSSEGFVNSFHGGTPSPPPEEPEGGYSSAFTSLSSRRSDEEKVKESNEKWQQSQEKGEVVDEVVDLEDLPSREPSTATADPSLSQSPDLGKEIESLSATTSSSSSSDFADSQSPVSGKQRRDLILRTISENYSDLKSCYREGLRKNSQMKGKVVMGWAMDPQGRVLAAEVQTSQLKNKQVEKCMVDRLSGWRFPRQAKAQGTKDRMTYTFQFVPENE